MEITKFIVLITLPISILILLDHYSIFSINIFIDIVLVGAIAMIILQGINMMNIQNHQKGVRIINVVMILIFVAPAVAYFVRGFIGSYADTLPLIIGGMLFLESLYAMH